MNKNYEIKDILNAVDVLLDENKKAKPLVLMNEINQSKMENKIPEDTEKIILQAEKFLKK